MNQGMGLASASHEIDAVLGLARASEQYEDALSLAQQAFVLARSRGCRLLQGSALSTLAEIELTHGNHELGVLRAKEALDVHRANGDETGVHRTLRLL